MECVFVALKCVFHWRSIVGSDRNDSAASELMEMEMEMEGNTIPDQETGGKSEATVPSRNA